MYIYNTIKGEFKQRIGEFGSRFGVRKSMSFKIRKEMEIGERLTVTSGNTYLAKKQHGGNSNLFLHYPLLPFFLFLSLFL